MAQKVEITHVSDLSGEEIPDTDRPAVPFAFDGVEYTVDLTSDEAEAMRKALEPYLAVATKVGRASKRSGGKKSADTGPSAAEIRAWALQNGHDVPERGRIPEKIREAYEAAS